MTDFVKPKGGMFKGMFRGIGLGRADKAAGHTDYTADANCRGAWLFADNLNDASGEGNTLTAAGDATYSVDRPAGFSTGKSRTYDGTGDWDTIASGSLSVNFPGSSQAGNPGSWANMTVAFWLKRPSADGEKGIIGKGGTWAGYASWNGSAYNDLELYAYDGTDAATPNTGIIPNNTWTHYCIVFVGASTKYRVSVNGASPTDYTLTNVNTITSNNWNAFYLARSDGTIDPAACLIYQPIIFDRALSDAEATEIATYGITGLN